MGRYRAESERSPEIRDHDVTEEVFSAPQSPLDEGIECGAENVSVSGLVDEALARRLAPRECRAGVVDLPHMRLGQIQLVPVAGVLVGPEFRAAVAAGRHVEGVLERD